MKFDWDDGNRAKCSERVPIAEIEAVPSDNRTRVIGDPCEGETRFRATGRNGEGRRVSCSGLVARVIEYEGMTQKRQCHARESGHPDLAARAGALDSRLRGNDTTLKSLILNDAPH